MKWTIEETTRWFSQEPRTLQSSYSLVIDEMTNVSNLKVLLAYDIVQI